MIDEERLQRFRSMDSVAPHLQQTFNSLTGAHMFFQGPGELRTISVSDVLENGSIEATFHGVHIKFELLLEFGPNRTPRGRVICMQCHCTYGIPQQELLGSFHFDEDGRTDLQCDLEGSAPRMDRDAQEIVLRFLDLAFSANGKI